MQKKIYIKSLEQIDDALIFYAENTDIAVQELQPKQHMLVDSDNLAFLYILESEQGFVYVSIPHTVWPEWKQLQAEAQKAYVKVNEAMIELEGLQEELEYLIHNIEGNANYGEELVHQVETIFL